VRDDYVNTYQNIDNQNRLLNMLRKEIDNQHAALVEHMPNNTKIHYISTKHPAAGRWLLCRETNIFTHNDFGILMASRFNLPLPSLQHTNITQCLCSFKRRVDQHGNHLLACCAIPKDANNIKRHNKILDLIYDLCKEARLSPSKEVKYIFKDNKRIDIFLPASHLHQNSSVLLDLACTHSTPDLHLKNQPHNVNIYEQKISQKLKEAYDDKTNTYQEEADQKNLILIPLIMESHGAMHPVMDKFIYQCCEVIATNIGSSVGKVLSNWRSRISAHLQACNARTLRERIARLHNVTQEVDDDKIEIQHMLDSDQL